VAKHWWKVLAALILMLLVLFAPASMQAHFMVFALACVVGFYVITNVTHSLHTPLMSETNAISEEQQAQPMPQSALPGTRPTVRRTYTNPAVAAAARRAQQQAAAKLGRNDPCWCGSGLKYKKCHGKDLE
jgi:hypothetical protein